MDQLITSILSSSSGANIGFGLKRSLKRSQTMKRAEGSAIVMPSFSMFPTSTTLSPPAVSPRYQDGDPVFDWPDHGFGSPDFGSLLDSPCNQQQQQMQTPDNYESESASAFCASSLGAPVCAPTTNCSGILWENFIYSSPTRGRGEDVDGGSTTSRTHSPDHHRQLQHELEERTTAQEKSMDADESAEDDVESDATTANSKWKVKNTFLFLSIRLFVL